MGCEVLLASVTAEIVNAEIISENENNVRLLVRPTSRNHESEQPENDRDLSANGAISKPIDEPGPLHRARLLGSAPLAALLLGLYRFRLFIVRLWKSQTRNFRRARYFIPGKRPLFEKARTNLIDFKHNCRWCFCRINIKHRIDLAVIVIGEHFR